MGHPVTPQFSTQCWASPQGEPGFLAHASGAPQTGGAAERKEQSKDGQYMPRATRVSREAKGKRKPSWAASGLGQEGSCWNKAWGMGLGKQSGRWGCRGVQSRDQGLSHSQGLWASGGRLLPRYPPGSGILLPPARWAISGPHDGPSPRSPLPAGA